MKNKFLGFSIVYWFVIFVSIYKLVTQKILPNKFVWVFFAGSVLLYVLLVTYNHFAKKHDKKGLVQEIKPGETVVYYESRIQYYGVVLIALLFFGFVTIFNWGNFGNVTIYFAWISVFAFLFLLAYRPSVYIISDKGFRWRKGWTKIECPWNDVIAVHYDPAVALSNFYRNFTSTAFFIETKGGMTQYADKANIKRKGLFTFSPLGDELIREIKNRSHAPELVGAVSTFKQKQKLRDVVLLPLALFLIPIIILIIYFAVYGPL